MHANTDQQCFPSAQVLSQTESSDGDKTDEVRSHGRALILPRSVGQAVARAHRGFPHAPGAS